MITRRFTGNVCSLCSLSGTLHTHHIEFKKMGGRKRQAKGSSEDESNKIKLCHVCHAAAHNIYAIDASGFCCDTCVFSNDCEISQARGERC